MTVLPVLTERDIDWLPASRLKQGQLVSAEAPNCCLLIVSSVYFPTEWTETYPLKQDLQRRVQNPKVSGKYSANFVTTESNAGL